MDAKALLAKLHSLTRKQKTLLIGIDGQGASGKTTLAENLRKLDPTIRIIHMDDFYFEKKDRPEGGPLTKPIGGDFNWRRLEEQVLKPLAEDKKARFQRYDWDTDSLKDWHEIEPGSIVIIEGIYAIRPELKDYYDYTIWMDSPQDVRLERGIKRNGIETKTMWLTEWMPHEDRYVKIYKPNSYAHQVITCG